MAPTLILNGKTINGFIQMVKKSQSTISIIHTLVVLEATSQVLITLIWRLMALIGKRFIIPIQDRF